MSLKPLVAADMKPLDAILKELIPLLHARDAKMRSYYKSVDDGFDGGYPADWDNDLCSFLSTALRELAEAGLGVVPEKGTSVGSRIGAGEPIEPAFEEATKAKGWNSARRALEEEYRGKGYMG